MGNEKTVKVDICKMTDKEVKKLYKEHPEIGDCYYENKISLGYVGCEIEMIKIRIDKQVYLIMSDPTEGDTWLRVKL